MSQSPADLAMGCGGFLLTAGSFLSGLYLGNSSAKGHSLDPAMVKTLKYLPAIAGAVYAPICFAASSNLEDMVSSVRLSGGDPDVAKGCTIIGCGPILGAAFHAGVTYLGYVVGQALNRI
jgi:hypothetical protein